MMERNKEQSVGEQQQEEEPDQEDENDNTFSLSCVGESKSKI